MKYMQTGGFQGQPLMRLTLLWTLLFMSGLWVTNGFMFLTRMRPTPAGVQAYYLGSAEDYSNPRSVASMLETSHAHFPIMGVVVLMLTHLMIFAPYSDRIKRWFISLSFVSAFGGEAAGWGVRFLQPPALYAWLKLLCFFVFQGCLAFLIVGLAAFLLAWKKRSPRAPARAPVKI